MRKRPIQLTSKPHYVLNPDQVKQTDMDPPVIFPVTTIPTYHGLRELIFITPATVTNGSGLKLPCQLKNKSCTCLQGSTNYSYEGRIL